VAIEARNVTKRFGDFVALDDVSITVASNSLTALLGPSGSGKSTLLRVIAGLEVPDSGDIFISGKEATASHRRSAASASSSSTTRRSST
jgi:ABC-type sugar transport systems, ATPase components